MSEDIKNMLKGLSLSDLIRLTAEKEAEEKAEKERAEREERERAEKEWTEKLEKASALISEGKIAEALKLFPETESFSPINSCGDTIWLKMSEGKILSHATVTQRNGVFIVCTGNESAVYNNCLDAFLKAGGNYSDQVNSLIVKGRKPREAVKRTEAEDITPEPQEPQGNAPEAAPEASVEVVEEVIDTSPEVLPPAPEETPQGVSQDDENSDDAFGDEEVAEEEIPF